jgi:predicted nuclease with TOPRIM domain
MQEIINLIENGNTEEAINKLKTMKNEIESLKNKLTEEENKKKEIIEDRNKLKEKLRLVKSKIGLKEEEPISEEILSKKISEIKISKDKTIEELKNSFESKISELQSKIEEKERQVREKEIKEAVLSKASYLSKEVNGKKTYDIIINDLTKNAKIEDGEVVYVDSNGEVLFDSEGNKMTLERRIKILKEEEWPEAFVTENKPGFGKSVSTKVSSGNSGSYVDKFLEGII